jgi:hypothetical protein
MLLPVFVFGFIGLVFGSALVSRVETGELASSASVGMNEELVATGDIASSSSEVNKKLFRFMKAMYNGDIQVAEKLVHDYPSVFMPFKKSFVDEFLNPFSSGPKKLIKRKSFQLSLKCHLFSSADDRAIIESLLPLEADECAIGYAEGLGFICFTPNSEGKDKKSGFAVRFIHPLKDIQEIVRSLELCDKILHDSEITLDLIESMLRTITLTKEVQLSNVDLLVSAVYIYLFILLVGSEMFINSIWPSLTIYAINDPLIDLLNHITSSILSYNDPNTEYYLGAVVQTEDSCIPVNLTWTYLALTLLIIRFVVILFLKP